MNERREFLATIAADPANWSAKRVYADWLEERGRESWDADHAELIRVGWELTTLPLDEVWPTAAAGYVGSKWQRLNILQDREAELFAKAPFSLTCRGPDWWQAIPSEVLPPVYILRLEDWHGIDLSLPPDPANALPFLRRLELPRSAAVPRLGVAVEHLVDSMPAADHFWITMESDFHRLFGRSPDGTPRVTVAFWNDTAAFRATFPPDAEPVVVPPV